MTHGPEELKVNDEIVVARVGTRQKRSEDPRLLTGNGMYVDDHVLPGMLHVAFRRSDQSHARILSIEVDGARAMEGVVAVVSFADLESEVTAIRATSRMVNYHATDIWPLARDKVRFVGEAVVAVIAESRYIAEDAMAFVNIEYEALGAVADPELAVLSDAPLLHEEAGTNILVEREFRRGEVDIAMFEAAVKVQGRFRFHRKTPLAMENRTYLADYNSGRRTLTLYSSTGSPGIVKDALAGALGISGSRLRVIAPDVGGSFGGKGSLYPEEILVCLMSRRLGRPVKWTSDRMEDLASTSQAFDQVVHASLGLATDGTILGLTADTIGDVGAYSIYPWTAGLEPVQVVSFMPGPYRVANYHGRVRGVATSKSPMGPYRGVGRPSSTFVMERLMDMAARELGMDPRELRRKNLIREEEFPYRTAVGIVWDRSGFQECLEGACDGIGYDQLREFQAQARSQGRWIGIGLASYAELSGIGSRMSVSPGMPINTGTEICKLIIDSTGGVTASFGIASHGQGLETSLAQVIADELGASFENITIIHGDTDAVPHGTGTYASRSAVLAGGAAILSSRPLKQRLKIIGAHLLECDAQTVQVAEGFASDPATGRRISIPDMAHALYSQAGRLPVELRAPLEETQSYDPMFGTASSSTHVAMVEINTQTYGVHIHKYVVAEDCGRIINPMIVDGQVRGAVAQGIGAALFEEIVYDERGQLLTASLVDYLAPTAPEIPDIGIVHIETKLPDNLGGFRGMGEGGTIGAPAAIANAISDAIAHLGLGINELPVTPERLYQLIHPSA